MKTIDIRLARPRRRSTPRCRCIGGILCSPCETAAATFARSCGPGSAAVANGHLAEAHARAGSIDAAKDYARQAVVHARDFIRGRDAYNRQRGRA